MTKASCLALVLVACTPDKPAEPAKTEASKVATKADAKATDAKKAEAKADDTKADEAKSSKTWSFDDLQAGAVPPDFDPVQTGEKVDPPATWAIVADAEAPSPPHAFGVTKSTGVNKTFNTGLIKGTSYKDFEISVMLRPTSGANNQGGGVMFRAKGTDDHYIARWNPVENNFRIYALLGGARVDIAAAPLELDPKVWHNLRVTVVGDRIECFVDDKPVAQANDKSLPDAGMIGLWTKGDAATLFDDLTVTVE